METILLTGAGGFIGRHVAAALSGRGRIVTPRENASGRRLDLLRADDRRTLIETERPGLLIHLAWVTEHGKFWSSPLNAEWEAASCDLFDRFYAAGGRRVVGMGSCAEYDWTTGAARFAENAPLAPHTDYGAAKVRTAERLERAAAGGEWSWGRVFFSFGPGEPRGRLIPLMLQSVSSGEPLDIGPGGTQRDFWDVRNLGAAIAALALSDVRGPVNLASGTATSFSDLADFLEGLGGVSGVIRTDRRPLGLGEPAQIVADATRLTDDVGFRADVSLRQGLGDYHRAWSTGP